MANTGVLPFVRGVDFTHYDFSEEKFPEAIRLMTGVQWLKLDRTKLSKVPKEMGQLQKLEHLSLTRNNLEKLFGELTDLSSLRTLNLRRNKVKSSGVPPELFHLDELTTLDLGHNNLKEVPEGLERAKSLLVLNLSYNHIESIPSTLFINLNDLLFLDLSNNNLETLPPQTRRLVNLQTLILNNNPLGHFQLRQLPSLMSLETLHMRNTQRTLNNFPTNLENLTNLKDLDLSENQLPKVPEAIYSLQNLKRLNLAANEIAELSTAVELWQKLESLILSNNKLKALPTTLCKLTQLRRLYVNDNLLDFEGIPSGVGKLCYLEVFSAANNLLEMIPEGLCRCGSLKKLNLSTNRLITLPESVHLLSDLKELNVDDNPDLVMPAKPTELAHGSGVEFYNVDFSLQHQLRLAGANVPAPARPQNSSKDPIARKIRLKRSRREQEEADKILKGMEDIAKEKSDVAYDDLKAESLKPKRWDEALEKPPLDYSEFFEDEAGQVPGLAIWEIENFLPNSIDEAVHGKFYEGDCYIILQTALDDNGALTWQIYFWIGEKATLDKRACAAIHAVNLRNFLGAQCRTIREEQNDESEEFLALFDTEITYIAGGRTNSGFFTVEEVVYETRLYRAFSVGQSFHLEPVAVCVDSLDPRFVFVLDAGLKIFLWYGKKAKNTIKSKARLLAEKINKNERKNKAEIFTELIGAESKDFWGVFGLDEGVSPDDLKEHIDMNFEPTVPRLYQVKLGAGYLELPQVEIPHGKLVNTLLNSKTVHILDCHLDVFVWFGKKSTRLVRAAAIKLSQELFNMIERPDYAKITRVQEGTEIQIFKTKFIGWDEVIAVDFTRTAESVRRTGADLTKWAKQQEIKTDLMALFQARQQPVPVRDAQQLMDEWNEDLEGMEAFVLDGKKFVKMPTDEIGHFYSQDCYAFLCRYWAPYDDEVDDAAANGEEIPIDKVLYFWQGRDASSMGWLTFKFSLQKRFESLCNYKLETVRMFQQQENLKFMAHFKRKFIIHTGKRKLRAKTEVDPSKTKEPAPVEFFQLRSNGSILCTRLIQIKPDATLLNSAFCYLLNVPIEQDCMDSSIVYVWIGSKSTPDEAHLIEEIANDMFNSPWVSLQMLNEGEEPDNFFWVALGGKKPYDTDATFMDYTRLFRCSNEKGYFTVSEKCADFCQDDLADDDIMILDNGEQVFLWLGEKCSEVEIKLAYKSAQVYVQHTKDKQPDRARKLMLALKNKESRRFTKCFHGWSAHKKALT